MLDDSCNSDIDISVDDRPCDPADVDRESLVGPRPAALAGAVVAEEGPRAAGSAREAFERSPAAAAAPGAACVRTMQP